MTDTKDTFEDFAQEWARSKTKQIFESATQEERQRMIGFLMRPYVSDEVAYLAGWDKCVPAFQEN